MITVVTCYKFRCFRCIIWIKNIFFWQSGTCPFLRKGELVFENPLKRSILKSQFQNSRNLDENDFFTRFTRKQLIIPEGTKNRLNTLLNRLLDRSLEVPTKYYPKIKMM